MGGHVRVGEEDEVLGNIRRLQNWRGSMSITENIYFSAPIKSLTLELGLNMASK